MKPTFLNQSRPFVTGMILKDDPNEVRYAVKNALYAGADSLGIQLCAMKPELRTEENLKAMFAAAGGHPIYVTNYKRWKNEELTDEECAEGLKQALRCGATLADIPGDLFNKADMELTKDEDAIRKQMALIDEIHSMGKEVLISSHVLRFLAPEDVLKIALEQQRRGADIAKIVTAADSDDEMHENLKATTLLKNELEIPFVFLSAGTHAKLHRLIGPALGCFAFLAVYEHDSMAFPPQPTIAVAKAVRDNVNICPDLIY